MLIRAAEVEGRACDVRLREGAIGEVAPGLSRMLGEEVLEARGGALLPGLHDHHLHLLAMAAARVSVACGPPWVYDRASLARALGRARPGPGGWLRGTGYHESVAGELGRDVLDALGPRLPVRIQHRGGACWMLNGAAVAALGLDGSVDAVGVERDARGRATGRLFRLDAWLRARLPAQAPDLAPVGRALARAGVTGVTDATVTNDTGSATLLADARARGDLPQRIHLLGGPGLETPGGIGLGAVKFVLDDARLPDPDALSVGIEQAHAEGRAVAIHCVTRGELAMAVSAWRAAGSSPGDRVEHASVCPPELVAELVRLGVTAVLQPGFVYERGDDYLRDVASRDRPLLVRVRGLLDAGVAVAGGTDAPFGSADPWRAMRAAVGRRTRTGRVLGDGERLTPERALALFMTPLRSPAGPPRRVQPGSVADLCLLRLPWREARSSLDASLVRATFVGGARIDAC